MASVEDELPRWGSLPNAAVAIGFVGAALTNMATGWRSVACVGLGVLYAFDVGRCLRRPLRLRGRRLGSLMLLGLLRPLIVPALRVALWLGLRAYLYDFARKHRGVLQPGERPLLTLRERADDGDVWVLSNQAIYIGRNERRLPRTPRENVTAVSEATLGTVRVVTLSVKSQSGSTRVVTGCFNDRVYKRPLQRLLTELTRDG